MSDPASSERARSPAAEDLTQPGASPLTAPAETVDTALPVVARGSICTRPFEWFEVGNQPRLGDVFLCCPTWLPTPAGNLGEQSVAEIWNGPVAREIRASILDGSYRFCDKARCPYLHNEGAGPVRSVESVVDPAVRQALEQAQIELSYGPRVINCCYDRSCNLACPSCRLTIIVERGRERQIMDLQDRITAQALHDAQVLYITGSGDPFGSPFFRRWLQTLRRADAPVLKRIHLHTNAQMWTPRLWQTIAPEVRALVTSTEISIDAATAGTYAINRWPGRFERLLENLEFVRSLRADGPLRYVAVHMVVQENNFDEMPAFVELGRRFDADRVLFSQLSNWGTFSEEEYASRAVHRPSHPRHDEFRALLRSPFFDDRRVFLGNLSRFRDAARPSAARPPVTISNVARAERPGPLEASSANRPPVQSLWIGGTLSAPHRLAIRSFVANGHPYQLYAYDPPDGLPEGVTVLDAASILPRDQVFTYRRGFGKGSVSAFSNLFRYVLLLEKGGWWVDTDLVCLRPFDDESPYVFATERHPDGSVTTASCAIRSPIGAAWLAWCIEVCRRTDMTTIEWGEIGPRLVHKATERFDLTRFRTPPHVFAPIDYASASDLVTTGFDVERLVGARAVHLWHQKWVANDLDPDYAPAGSLYSQLRERYGMDDPTTAATPYEQLARHAEFQRQRLEALRAERDEFDYALDASRAESEALRHELETARAELESARYEISTFGERVESLKAEHERERAASLAEIAEARRAIEELKDRLGSELDAVRDEFSAYRATAETELADTRYRLERMKNTMSWKVTAPLRFMLDGLDRLLRAARLRR